MMPRRSDYLHTEVTTATPQKLQLMLIEAALRSALQARQHWAAGQDNAACLSLIRGQDILAELQAVLKPHAEETLVGDVAAIYLYIYRSLVQANLDRSHAHLDNAIRVLEVERETWRQLCQQLDAHSSPWSTGSASYVA
jgi:flagellar secretion chaperone FliS